MRKRRKKYSIGKSISEYCRIVFKMDSFRCFLLENIVNNIERNKKNMIIESEVKVKVEVASEKTCDMSCSYIHAVEDEDYYCELFKILLFHCNNPKVILRSDKCRENFIFGKKIVNE